LNKFYVYETYYLFSSKQKIKPLDFLHAFEKARCSEFVNMIVDSAFLFDIIWWIPLVAMFTGGGPLPQIAGMTSYCISLIKKKNSPMTDQFNPNSILFIYFQEFSEEW